MPTTKQFGVAYAAATLPLTGAETLSVVQGGVTRDVGAQDIVLIHDATSTAANRFFCPSSANVTLGANDTLECWYDATSSRWRVHGL